MACLRPITLTDWPPWPADLPSVTLAEYIARAEKILAAASPTAKLDAEVLAMHACHLTRAALYTAAWHELDDKQRAVLDELIGRRERGEPVAYITGTREFWSLPLHVTPATLIPRPETEQLVETALARIPHDAEWHIADLGTGSGAIAIAIAHERPHCRIVATDRSEAALEIAEGNLRGLRLSNVELRHGDWLDALGSEPFDMIVSNPPYVRHEDSHLTQGDVRFEPRAALDGGIDGLDAIRVITQFAREHLRMEGYLVLEHGFDQADSVAALLRAHHYRDIVCHRDLAGHNRVTECRAPASL